MTVSMQSFDGSDLGVFIKSPLNVRGGEDTGFIWHCSRGSDAPRRTRIYELDPVDFSSIRSVNLAAEVLGEGCGGKADVLYVAQWDPFGEGNGDLGTLMEYPTDAASWAVPPLTPIRSTELINADGIGGDTEIMWASFIGFTGSAVVKWDATNFTFGGIISSEDTAYKRCDCIGGSATVLWCGQFEAGYPDVEHHMQLDPDDLVTQLQNVPHVFGDGWNTEGIGGSGEHVWANRVDFNDRDATGTVMELDTYDLHIIRSAATPGPNPYGTGGN